MSDLSAASQVGARFTIRFTLPSGQLTDLVGVLLEVSSSHVTVRDRRGQDHLIETDAIVASRRVPTEPAQRLQRRISD